MTETNKTTILDFLRHGEPEGGQYFRGVTDDPLTELGWQQMFDQCMDRQWDVMISSPLRRCREFAGAWCDQQQRTLHIDPSWAEINFGDWEGQTAEQIAARNPEALQGFYADPMNHTPPNAETYRDFAARIDQGLENVLTNHAGERVLIVTHAGVIRALFSLLLGVPVANAWQIEVPHACLTRFSCFHDQNGRFIQLNFHKSG